MITFNKFKSKINESLGVLDTRIIAGHHVVVSQDFSVSIDGNLVATCSSLAESLQYAKSYIENFQIVEEVDTQLPSEKIVELINHFHEDVKITDTIVEQYNDLNESLTFSLDPVLLEMKSPSVNFGDKVEFVLNDGTKIAISEHTLQNLSSVVKDKYQIVEYMRESTENFMRVIRKLS